MLLSALSSNKAGNNALQESGRKASRRVNLNALWLLSGRVSAHALTILFTILIARKLGEVILGEYALIAAVIFIANGLSTFGTDRLLIRDIAGARDFSALPGALALQLLLSLLLVAAIFVAAPRIPNLSTDAITALQIYSLALFPLAFVIVSSSALQGVERMDVFASLNLFTAAFSAAGIWFFISPQSGIISLSVLLLGIQVLSAIVFAAITYAYVPEIRDAIRMKQSDLFSVLRSSAPIALFGILATVYQRLGIYLTTALAGAAQTGWFTAAARVVEAPKFVHVAMLAALLPAMSQAHGKTEGSGDSLQLAVVFSNSWRRLLLYSGLVALVLSIFAGPIVLFLYGDSFAQSVETLQILAWGLVPFAVSQYLATRFLAAKQEKYVVAALVVGISILSGLMAWWIPVWGLSGAAWAILAAEVVLAAILLLQWLLFGKTD